VFFEKKKKKKLKLTLLFKFWASESKLRHCGGKQNEGEDEVRNQKEKRWGGGGDRYIRKRGPENDHIGKDVMMDVL
jgi:hypothetical protein